MEEECAQPGCWGWGRLRHLRYKENSHLCLWSTHTSFINFSPIYNSSCLSPSTVSAAWRCSSIESAPLGSLKSEVFRNLPIIILIIVLLDFAKSICVHKGRDSLWTSWGGPFLGSAQATTSPTATRSSSPPNLSWSFCEVQTSIKFKIITFSFLLHPPGFPWGPWKFEPSRVLLRTLFSVQAQKQLMMFTNLLKSTPSIGLMVRFGLESLIQSLT